MKSKIKPKPKTKTKTSKNYNITTKYDGLIKKLGIDDTYTKPFSIKIKYERVKDLMPPKQDLNFQADLLFLPTTNKGYKYLLTMVDLWSDEIDAEPLKTKKPTEVLKAMKTIFKRGILKKPEASIRTDSGTEFLGDVKKYMHDQSIYHSITQPGRHRQTGNIENVNKILGQFLMTYLHNKELKDNEEYNEWTDILKTLITELNKIRKRPDGDLYSHEATKTLNMNIVSQPPKYNVGDLVYRKLDIPKNAMNKEQLNDARFRSGDLRWDIHEPRKIVKILYYPKNIRYMIKGFPNVSYTAEELKPANDENEKFAVRKIIDKKKVKGRIYYLVWFKKELKKDAVWISRKDLIEDGVKESINEYEKNN